MNILIVDALAANEGRRKFSRDAIGVGPRLLAGICDKQDVYSRITRVEDLLEQENAASIKKPEIFFISAMTVDEIAVRRVVRKIKEENNSAFIALGGPITTDPKILQKLEINLAVYGEGEFIVDELISNDFSIESLSKIDNEIHEIKGKYYIKRNDTLKINSFDIFTPSINHVMDYPDHWFSKVYVETVRGCSNYYRGELVKQSGGCSDCGNCEDIDDIITGNCPEDIPPGCGFCSVPSIFGPSRSRAVDSIITEVEGLFEKGVRRIVLSAPGFLDFQRERKEDHIYSPTSPQANLERVEELLSKLVKIRDSQENLCSISIENVKPSLVDIEATKIIGKYIPNTSISIGCETFDLTHSDQIGRPSSPTQALTAAKNFKEVGINPQIYLIHSLPGETIQSLDKTIEVVKGELTDIAEKITVYKYLPLPNSPFTKTEVSQPIDRHLLQTRREELKKAIIDFNFRKKEEMLDSEIIVIAAEKDRIRKNTYICYPLNSGPAVSVESQENIIGETLKVRVNKVVSDKLVVGHLLES
ncbi:MAG: B12-binding domain-containing radical SAM protein [Candidatus Heimdallarchaeaceae archaeon]